MKGFGECSRRNNYRLIEESNVDVDDEDIDGSELGDSDVNVRGRRKDCLDLTQVLALLLVPLLMKAERSLMRREETWEEHGVENDGGGSGNRFVGEEGKKVDCNNSVESTPSPLLEAIDGQSTFPDSVQSSILEHLKSASPSPSPTHLPRDNSGTKRTIHPRSRNITSEATMNATHLESPQRQLPRWTKFHREKGDKLWPDSDLIESVLGMILHDATGDPNPQPLSKELLRQILNFYGEEESAEDEVFLEHMIMAAAPSKTTSTTETASESIGIIDVEGEPILFDKYAFARALTHDIQNYNISNENHVTTNYYDVFQSYCSTKEGEMKKRPFMRNNVKTVQMTNSEGNIRPVQRVFTFPSIDYTADTFRSKGFVILLW